jgi:hypothetical protein
LKQAQPIAITFPASSKAIDALLGTNRGSPRVVPEETKLAVTDCASRSSAVSRTLGAVAHVVFSCSIGLFDEHPFRTVALDDDVRFPEACRLRRLRSTAQLNVGKRLASKGIAELYEGLWRSPLAIGWVAGFLVALVANRLAFPGPRALA